MPPADLTGNDSFTYTIPDTHENSSTATVDVTVETTVGNHRIAGTPGGYSHWVRRPRMAAPRCANGFWVALVMIDSGAIGEMISSMVDEVEIF